MVQRFQFAKGGGFDATLYLPFIANGQFILEDQLQELGMREPIGHGFFQSDLQGLAEPREAQFSQSTL